MLLFELKKRSSNQIVSPFWGKLIGAHYKVARAVVRAPSAKTFTSTKLAFSHFWIWLEHMCGFRTHPRTHPHGVRQPILQQKMPFVFACNFGKNQSIQNVYFKTLIFSKSYQTSSTHEKVSLWVKVAINLFKVFPENRLVCTMKMRP